MSALTEGVKFDENKPRTDLLSPPAILGLSQVLTHGAEKYADHNWRKGMKWSRLTGAAMRHLLALMAGEDTDPDSGLPHIDHLLCCAMFLSEYQKTGNGTDDRFSIEALVRRVKASLASSVTIDTGDGGSVRLTRTAALATEPQRQQESMRDFKDASEIRGS